MINVAMPVFMYGMDTMGGRLRAARISAGFSSASKAADRLGLKPSTYTAHENGQNEFGRLEAQRYAAAFNTSWQWLLSGEGGEPPISGRAPGLPTNGGFNPPPTFLGEKDLPVFSAVEGGAGEMVVSTDPIDMVPRPWYMGNVKDGYAVLVVGESMVPAFRPGEMAIVNPRLPPMRGKDHILISLSEGDGSFHGTIKHVLGWTESEWKLEQYNPPAGKSREFRLSRKDWPQALRVVGKYIT